MLAKRLQTPTRPGAASRHKVIVPRRADPTLDLGWNAEKVAAFEKGFWEFASHVRINSKEKGGNYPISEGLYEGQKRFVRALFDGLAEDKHTIKCLKSRQLGMSTIVELLVVFWIGVFDGMQGGIVFDTGPHMQSARRRIKALIDNLPRGYRFPHIVADNRDGLTLSNQSQLLFMSAGVRETSSSGTLGRSSGLNLLWASELCSWQNTEGLIALKNALSATFPNRLYIEESTARGFDGCWHDEWMQAKGNELEEIAYFAGWWAKDDQRIRRGTPAWKVYGVEPPTDAEQRRIRLVKELYDFEVDREQLAWYRRYIDPTRERDDSEPEDGYQIQDQPWTEDEAFQQSGSPFFRADKLTVAAHAAKGLKFRPYRFWPGDSIISCDIQPSKTWKEVELKVWEDPVSEGCYVVAGDPAYGRNEFNDNSCAQVLRCYADAVEQVAEYVSPIIEPHQFAWLLWTLVGWYGSAHQAQVITICELNGSGEEVLRQYNMTRQLLREGYLRTSAREAGISNIFHNGRNYVYSRTDSMNTGHNWWWKTTSQLKVQMSDGLRGYFHNDVVTIRSYDALEEMKTIAREGDKIEAPKGKRDDRFASLAFGVRAWEERLRRDLARTNRTREADRIRRAGSAVDVYALFQKNLLEDMFKRKAAGRRAAALAAMQRPGMRMR